VVISFINLVPFVSVLGARIFLGEPVSFTRLLGGILTVTGVYLVSSQDTTFYTGTLRRIYTDSLPHSHHVDPARNHIYAMIHNMPINRMAPISQQL